MKKYLTILSIGILLSIGACAQKQSEGKVPVAVKASFSDKFPKAKKVNGDMGSTTEWKVEFEQEKNSPSIF
jgi:hypothetical protein